MVHALRSRKDRTIAKKAQARTLVEAEVIVAPKAACFVSIESCRGRKMPFRNTVNTADRPVQSQFPFWVCLKLSNNLE